MRYVVYFLEPDWFGNSSDGLKLNKSIFSNLVEYKKFCTILNNRNITFVTFGAEDSSSGYSSTGELFVKIINELEVAL